MENEINRESATSIIMTDGGQPIKLTLIGSGNTCLVYRTEHNDIIKEFSPVIGGRVAMSRKQSANGPLSMIEGLSALDRSIVTERFKSFTEEYSLVKELYSGFQERNDNMFLIPEQKRDTSLGLCHWCRYTGGNTLSAVFDEYRAQSKTFQDYVELVLPLVITLFDELEFYHSRDILNLDVKPDNLFAIKFNGKYIGIRNLDFGSARRASDLIKQIRDFAKQNSHLPQSLLILQISSKFFASSMPYYDENRIDSLILQCLEGKTGDSEIISQLKLLDVLAAWKVLLYAMSGEIPVRSSMVCESDAVYAQFMSLCRTYRLSESPFVFESYNVFFTLYMIMGRSFKGRLQYKLSAAEIRDSLSDVLCILQGIDENSRTERQILADLRNRALTRNETLLKRHGLRSVAEILDFWKNKTGASHPPSPQDLLWYLRFGCVHAEYAGRVQPLQVARPIDPSLFADVAVSRYRYVVDLSGENGVRIEDSPLTQVWRDLKEDESLFVKGAACTGKSTVMRVLEAELIRQGQPVFYYDCKDVGRDDMPEIGNELEGDVARIYMIDGLDELSDEFLPDMMEMLAHLQRCGCRLIISSRTELPESELKMQAFVSAELQSLSAQAVKLAAQEQEMSDETCVLIRNPLLLNVYKEMKQEDVTQAGLILKYFEKLLQSKGTDLPAEWVAERLGACLLGRAYGASAPYIPGAFRGVFEQTDGEICISASEEQYESFCMAVYLEKCMADHPELLMTDAMARLLSLNGDRGQTPLSFEQMATVCRYTAQLLMKEPEKVKERVVAKLETVETAATVEMEIMAVPEVKVENPANINIVNIANAVKAEQAAVAANLILDVLDPQN